jgi:hypothetical protein
LTDEWARTWTFSILDLELGFFNGLFKGGAGPTPQGGQLRFSLGPDSLSFLGGLFEDGLFPGRPFLLGFGKRLFLYLLSGLGCLFGDLGRYLLPRFPDNRLGSFLSLTDPLQRFERGALFGVTVHSFILFS